jgi:pimeloyl-ACP methyl ester carboxylesterase
MTLPASTYRTEALANEDNDPVPASRLRETTRNQSLFVPGWGATAGLYRRGLPAGWDVLELPTFRAGRGDLDAYAGYLRAEIERRPGPVTLAGHSLGAALALLAAAEAPESVERLILLSPSGLPLVKPLRASAVTFVGQLMARRYPWRELARALTNAALAPRAALRLARQVHDLDLTPALERIRSQGTRCTVIACTEDRLATPEHCRRLATLLDAEYRELQARDGHIWMITDPERLKRELAGWAT